MLRKGGMLSIMERTELEDCSLWGKSLRSSRTADVLMWLDCLLGVAVGRRSDRRYFDTCSIV